MRALFGGLIAVLILSVVLLSAWAMTLRFENEGLEAKIGIERQEFTDYRNSRKGIDAGWIKMHKEATSRAARWLAERNELKQRLKAAGLDSTINPPK